MEPASAGFSLSLRGGTDRDLAQFDLHGAVREAGSWKPPGDLVPQPQLCSLGIHSSPSTSRRKSSSSLFKKSSDLFSSQWISLDFAHPDTANIVLSESDVVAAAAETLEEDPVASSSLSPIRPASDGLRGSGFHPDGSGSSAYSMWMSEDEASTEEFADFRGRVRQEDESSEDFHSRTQYIRALMPLEGQRDFPLDQPLRAEFALPATSAGLKSVVDPNMIFCTPPHELRAYWKSSNILEVAPVDRWCGSTSYRIEIGPGIVPNLEDEGGLKFYFHTQSLHVRMFCRAVPEDPLRPIFRLIPNQSVDADRLLAGLSLTSRPKGMTGFLVSSVSRFQRATHTFKLHSKTAEAIEVVPVGPLPPNSVVELALAVGSFSLEGTNPSEEGFSCEFQTYPPLTIVSRFPGYFKKVPPGEAWRINFSNDLRLDEASLRDMVEIVPHVPFTVTTSFDSRICISPETEAFTTYRVTISGAISDVYGQTLGAPDSFSFTTGEWPPFDGWIKSQSSKVLVTHVGPKHTFEYLQRNVSLVRERIFVLRGDALPLISSSGDVDGEDIFKWIEVNGKCAYDNLRTFPSGSSEWSILDWSSILPHHGRIGILVEPAGEKLLNRLQSEGNGGARKYAACCILQRTSLAVSSVALAGTTSILVSQLDSGAPVAGARVREADGGHKLGTTDANGLLVVQRLPDKRLVVLPPDDTNPDDMCFFVAVASPSEAVQRPRHVACAFALDRQIYQPSQTVRVKLWARTLLPPHGSSLGLFKPGELLHWSCHQLKLEDENSSLWLDSDLDLEDFEDCVVVASGAAVFNACSAATVSFELASDLPDGKFAVLFRSNLEVWNERDVAIGTCWFQLQNPPKAPFGSVMTITTIAPGTSADEQSQSVGPRVGAPSEECVAIATVTVDQRQSGPLSGAQVKWQAWATDMPIMVPGEKFSLYCFGQNALVQAPAALRVAAGPAVSDLNDAGYSRLVLSWTGQDGWSRPIKIDVEAAIQDLFQRRSVCRASMILEPSGGPLIGVRLSRYWITEGDSIEMGVLCLGRSAPHRQLTGCPVSFCSGLVAQGQAVSGGVSSSSTTHSKSIGVSVDKGELLYSWTPESYGQFWARVECGDSRTTVGFLVAPISKIPSLFGPSRWSVETPQVSMAINHRRDIDEMPVGEKAEVLVIMLSLPHAYGVLLVVSPSNGTVLGSHAFQLDATGVGNLEFLIEESWFPSVKLRVLIFGTESLTGNPVWSTAVSNVRVSRCVRSLQVSVEAEHIRVNRATVQCIIKDQNGKPVSGADIVVLGGTADADAGLDLIQSFYPVMEDVRANVNDLRSSLLSAQQPEKRAAELKKSIDQSEAAAAEALAAPRTDPENQPVHHGVAVGPLKTSEDDSVSSGLAPLAVSMSPAGPSSDNKGSSAAGSSSLEDANDSRIGPEEDLRDKVGSSDASDSLEGQEEQEDLVTLQRVSRELDLPFRDTQHPSNPAPALPFVFCLVEYGSQRTVHVGPASFVPLALRVMQRLQHPGRRTIRDQTGDFQFVIERTAFGVCAVCVTRKNASADWAYSFLASCLKLIRTERFAEHAHDLLASEIGRWNEGNAPTQSASRAVLPTFLWNGLVQRLYGVDVKPATASSCPKSEWTIFEVGSGVTDGTGKIEVPITIHGSVPERLLDLTILAASPNHFFGRARGTLCTFPAVRVELFCPDFVRVGDEFEAVVRLTVRPDILTKPSDAVGAFRVKLETSLEQELKLKGESNVFDVSLEKEATECAFFVRLRAVRVGGRSEVKVGVLSVTVEAPASLKLENPCAQTSREFSIFRPSQENSRLESCVVVTGTLGKQTQQQQQTVAGDGMNRIGFHLSFLKSAAGSSLRYEGGVEVKLSNSPFVFLAPALQQVLRAGSEVVEVLSSRMLVICSVHARLSTLGLKHFGEYHVSDQLRRDAEKVLNLQGTLGGFGFWSRHSMSSAFLSAHASHALWETNKVLKHLNFQGVAAAALDRCRSFVDSASRAPVSSRKDVRARAYATYVGVKMGACLVSAAQAKRVALEEDHSDLDTLGWLLGSVCLSALGEKNAAVAGAGNRLPAGGGRFSTLWGLFGGGSSVNKEREDAMDALMERLVAVFDSSSSYVPPTRVSSHASVKSPRAFQETDFLFSEGRAVSVALEGLQLAVSELASTSQVERKSKVVFMNAKLDSMAARVLELRATDGTWATTHETSFACLGLARYFSCHAALESQDDLSETVLFGHETIPLIGKGSRQVHLPWNELVAAGSPELTLIGPSSHFVVSAEYTRNDCHKAPARASPSFKLWRRYEAVDAASDVSFDPASQTYLIRRGSRIRVVLGFSTSDASQVMLVDELCAGFSVDDGRHLRAVGKCAGPYGRAWEDHHVLYLGGRVEVFADRLMGLSERTFCSVVRAEFCGAFVVPPACVMERYNPLSQACSAGCLVMIKN